VEKPRALVILLSAITFDSRVIRQIDSLRETYSVSVISSGRIGREGLNHIKVRAPRFNILFGWSLLFGWNWLYYWNPFSQPFWFLLKIGRSEFDLVVANDAYAMPLALKVRGNPFLVADLHEFHPGENPVGSIRQKFKHWLVSTFMPQMSQTVTIGKDVSKLYSTHYKIAPKVVENRSSFAQLIPSPVDSNCIRLVHHGIYAEDRGIELLIEALSHLPDRFELNLVLHRAPIQRLRKIANRYLVPGSRLHFHAPVPPEDLPTFLNQFDIEVILVPWSNPNLKAGLPNKLFEAVQGRLAVCSGPADEIGRVLSKYKIGVLSDDHTPVAFARTLERLDSTAVGKMKAASHSAARELSFQGMKVDYAAVIRESSPPPRYSR